MPARKSNNGVNWGLIVSITVPTLTLISTLAAFYYSTNATLAKHDEQFRKLGEDFKSFGETSKQNFSEWLKINKTEQDKIEKNAKEEREIREKMREQFSGFVQQLTTSTVGTKIQVEAITKQLDMVTNKLDAISTVQQENRSIIRQQGKR